MQSSVNDVFNNFRNTINFSKIQLISVEVVEVYKRSCGVMTVGVSVNEMMLCWSLDGILFIFLGSGC